MPTVTKRTALGRLRWDLKDIQKNPLPFISAAPLDDNLQVWHANLKGTSGPYEGLVLHLELVFPDSYPANPPKISLFTSIDHPNVTGTSICLDLLQDGEWSSEREQMRPYTGWSGAFTVQTVLMQMQSFLLDGASTDRAKVQQAFRNSENFTCAECGHHRDEPLPPFPPSTVPHTDTDHSEHLPSLAPSKTSLSSLPTIVLRHSLLPLLSLGDLRQLGRCSRSLRQMTDEDWGTREENLQAIRCFFDKVSPLEDSSTILGFGIREEEEIDVKKKPNKTAATKTKAPSYASSSSASSSSSRPTPRGLPSLPSGDETLDIALICDCTGSMGGLLDQAKGSLLSIMSDLQDSLPSTRLRVSFVGYRDHCDGNNRIAKCAFSSNAAEVRSFISKQTAMGGGDEPEDVAGGLRVTLDLTWEGACRYAVLIADAPAHGRKYHNTHDTYPAGDPTGLQIEDLMVEFREKNIDFVFMRINNRTDKMLNVMKTAYDNEESGHAIQVCELGSNVRLFKDALVSSAREAVKASTGRRAAKYLSSPCDLVSLSAFERGLRLSSWKAPFAWFLPLVIDEHHWRRALPAACAAITMLSSGKWSDEDLSEAADLEDSKPAETSEPVEAVHEETEGWETVGSSSKKMKARGGSSSSTPCIDPGSSLGTFDPLTVLNILPKVMNSMVVKLMAGDVHVSSKALEGYCAFHHLFLSLCERFPVIRKEADGRIARFLHYPEARHKQDTPNLGEFLALLSVSDEFSWSDVRREIMEEVFDRNVLWILKEYPELKKYGKETGVCRERLQKSFDATLVSRRLLMFHSWFLQNVVHTRHGHPEREAQCSKAGKALDPPCRKASCALQRYNRAKGQPAPSQVDALQAACRRVYSSVSSWKCTFRFMGLPVPPDAQTCRWLRVAVDSSLSRGYHQFSRRPVKAKLPEHEWNWRLMGQTPAAASTATTVAPPSKKKTETPGRPSDSPHPRDKTRTVPLTPSNEGEAPGWTLARSSRPPTSSGSSTPHCAAPLWGGKRIPSSLSAARAAAGKEEERPSSSSSSTTSHSRPVRGGRRERDSRHPPPTSYGASRPSIGLGDFLPPSLKVIKAPDTKASRVFDPPTTVETPKVNSPPTPMRRFTPVSTECSWVEMVSGKKKKKKQKKEEEKAKPHTVSSSPSPSSLSPPPSSTAAATPEQKATSPKSSFPYVSPFAPITHPSALHPGPSFISLGAPPGAMHSSPTAAKTKSDETRARRGPSASSSNPSVSLSWAERAAAVAAAGGKATMSSSHSGKGRRK
uniref:UBC core domain-containing protein n=1 Tax=Chromera velia CCMP2878 TaxID=1169474 RepID=A0A0G4H247_9ALVE|eukprot:Cvel_5578.t1-p1 / transcript=Cvel_5578.t1 / gene=Cvel_5578 / organism=Chromera_velia_CCMP2878 / gene_product=Alpha-protein kinase vwkA, putative / transcript_product=Alpha-protein kinase vwkA, putative / location=Cvel_scaffold262:40100-44948(-) / protein_length=1268 / sequence_SO=supercontig / SO=protein_coding / is_pseudo=false